MTTDVHFPIRRIPTLVGLCQRVCANNIDFISSLGDDLTYDLVKPILERCNEEQLLRLEESSTHLQASTPEIWRSLCYSIHPLAKHTEPEDEPESWKDHYFFLKAAEEKRLEEASAKLRSQRHEAEERKKEREVKLTDRVPLPKRQRTGWGTNPAPKTLFQKTRTEASRVAKTMSQRLLPPMPQNGKRYSVLPKSASASVDFLPPSSGTSRVTVNNVVHRRPVTSSATSSASVTSNPSSASSSIPSTSKARPLTASYKYSPAAMSVSSKPPLRSDTTTEPRPLKPPAKKDPMSSLFVPKRRPNPQRP